MQFIYVAWMYIYISKILNKICGNKLVFYGASISYNYTNN
jgi:hypothetical protein